MFELLSIILVMSYGITSTLYSFNIYYNAALTDKRLMKILSIAVSIAIRKIESICRYLSGCPDRWHGLLLGAHPPIVGL